MSTIGGVYLNPFCFFNDSYTNTDFIKKEFWVSEQKKWGIVIHKFDHYSECFVKRFNTNIRIRSNEKILITIDGLLTTTLPDSVHSSDEGLVVICNHINTFLSKLILGGIFFTPISEKQIFHVRFENGMFSQANGGGDLYSNENLIRSNYRCNIPLDEGIYIKDFEWVSLRIIKSETLVNALEIGNQIVKNLYLKMGEGVLFLEAYSNYTLHKWNNTLLLGWAFIEILIDKLWVKILISSIVSDEINRKKRLEDNRTYTASIKIELLYSNGQISKDIYNSINFLRGIRNRLIHEGSFITQPDVEELFEVCKILIESITNIKPFFSNPGWTRIWHIEE